MFLEHPFLGICCFYESDFHCLVCRVFAFEYIKSYFDPVHICITCLSLSLSLSLYLPHPNCIVKTGRRLRPLDKRKRISGKGLFGLLGASSHVADSDVLIWPWKRDRIYVSLTQAIWPLEIYSKRKYYDMQAEISNYRSVAWPVSCR